MTPQEKAKELVDKFINDVGVISTRRAKQCAIIAVDEILSNKSIIKTIWDIEFWQEVKSEIEKL